MDSLPHHVMGKIASMTDASDIMSVINSSSKLRQMASTDSFWIDLYRESGLAYTKQDGIAAYARDYADKRYVHEMLSYLRRGYRIVISGSDAARTMTEIDGTRDSRDVEDAIIYKDDGMIKALFFGLHTHMYVLPEDKVSYILLYMGDHGVNASIVHTV